MIGPSNGPLIEETFEALLALGVVLYPEKASQIWRTFKSHLTEDSSLRLIQTNESDLKALLKIYGVTLDTERLHGKYLLEEVGRLCSLN